MSEERKAAERLLLRLLGIAAAFAVVRWVLPEIWDKLSPFIIAVPVAAALQPVIRFLQKRIRLKRSPASLIPVLLLLLVMVPGANGASAKVLWASPGAAPGCALLPAPTTWLWLLI